MDYHSCHCSSWYAIAFQKIIQELTQNILEPLDQIEKAADDMAHGNLEIDISYQGKMNWESLQKVSAIHLFI